MVAFEELFRISKGKPIVYQGKELRLVDVLVVAENDRYRIVFESSGGDRRQGIMLRSAVPIEVAAEVFKGPVVLWSDTAPREVELVMRGAGELRVKNVWDRGNGVPDSGHNGAAMVVEEITSGRRYRCNDGKPDDDFADIVFRIERMESAP